MPLRDEKNELGPEAWASAVLEEYKSLREESLAALDRQLGVVRFGMALVATLIALGIRTQRDKYVGGLTLTVFEPLVVCMVLAMWLGEVERSVRAGAFVAAIEAKLEMHTGAAIPALGWERWLRGLGSLAESNIGEDHEAPEEGAKRPTRRRQEFALLRVVGTFFLFLFPTMIAMYIGNKTLSDCSVSELPEGEHCYPVLADIALYGDLIGLVVLSVLFTVAYRRIRDLRKPPPVEEAWPTPVIAATHD